MVVTGKFCLGTLLLAGGPLPPLVEDDKEEMGEVEGPGLGLGDSVVPAPVLDVSVLDSAELFRMEEDAEPAPVPVASVLGQVDLFHVEEDPWDDMDLEMNPWADS